MDTLRQQILEMWRFIGMMRGVWGMHMPMGEVVRGGSGEVREGSWGIPWNFSGGSEYFPFGIKSLVLFLPLSCLIWVVF